MSSAAFWQNAQTPSTSLRADILAAWETNGQVYFDKLNPATTRVSERIAPPGSGRKRKHPVVATNARGETILAWTEGTGWQKAGDLAWQVFDRNGRPTSEQGRVPGGVPVWGFAAVFPSPDGGFVIVR